MRSLNSDITFAGKSEKTSLLRNEIQRENINKIVLGEDELLFVAHLITGTIKSSCRG
jgi:hypothetical protein